MKFFLHLSIMIAIVTAGISPACAFMSGQMSLIELCSPDGSIRTVEVPAALDPLAVPAPPHEEHHALDNVDDCTVCFAKTQGKSLMAAEISLAALFLPRYLAVSAGTFVPQSMKAAYFQPRAPPVFS
jgi:hypothetical protein